MSEQAEPEPVMVRCPYCRLHYRRNQDETRAERLTRHYEEARHGNVSR